LIAVLVAAVVGSGLLFAYFALNKTTTTSRSNSVVGNVRFLSSPNAPPGSLDEVEVTIQQIPAAPPGEQYYAWLQTGIEGSLPMKWPLTPHNGSLSFAYTDPQHNNLLTNNPRLFLITLETAGTNPAVANLVPDARRYYASLPSNIQQAATFDIRMCPQGGSNTTCY